MDDTSPEGPESVPPIGDAAAEPALPEALEPRPRFYERPAWRAVLITVVFLGLCTLLALLFPASYWRF